MLIFQFVFTSFSLLAHGEIIRNKVGLLTYVNV